MHLGTAKVGTVGTGSSKVGGSSSSNSSNSNNRTGRYVGKTTKGMGASTGTRIVGLGLITGRSLTLTIRRRGGGGGGVAVRVGR